MKHRTARWMTTEGLGASSISYLINDTFTTSLAAGAVNGTAAEPGPGTRTVVDTNSKLSIAADALSIATGGSGSGNPGLYYDLVTRAAGRMLIAQAVSTNETFAIGFDPNQLTAINHAVRWAGSSRTWQVYVNGLGLSVGNWTIGATYNIAVVMRATGAYFFAKIGGNWQLLYPSGAGTQDCYPAIAVESATSVLTVDYIRVPSAAITWLPTPLVSDGFSGASSDGLGHAEGVAGGLGSGGGGASWAGATATLSGGTMRHVVGVGAELLTNGSMEAGSPPASWVSVRSGILGTVGERTGGMGAQALLVQKGASTFPGAKQNVALGAGDWFAAAGWVKSHTGAERLRTFVGQRDDINTVYASSSATSYLAFPVWSQLGFNGRAGGLAEFRILSFDSDGSTNLDDVSVKALTLTTLFRTTDTGVASVFASVAVTLTTNTQAGVVLNLDSAVTPANFVIAYHNGTQIVADKCVAGAYTQLFAATVTYVAGARLEIRKDGTAYRVYYNTVFVSTQQTVADAGIISNTLHGTFSTYDLNEFDDLVIYATGSGGEYATLDTY